MDFGQLGLQQIVILLVIAVLVGWLAGVITRGGGFGLLGDIVVAICGAFAGHFLFGLLNIHLAAATWDSLSAQRWARWCCCC